MLVVDYISNFLKFHGITTVFGYQGGNISYMVDSIVRNGMNFVENYNEQASSFAANSFAEISYSFGVAISSSGPGAINMLNGIANAYYDGIPCLYITGDVNTAFRQKYKGVRQSEFQEVNIVRMAAPITKKCFQVENADEIPSILNEAVQIMFADRKGPVLINLAHNIQKSEVHFVEDYEIISKEKLQTKGNVEDVISTELEKSKNPVILLGNGCRNSVSSIRIFLERTKIPFASTLKALDIYPKSPHYLGFAGNYGTDDANNALINADLIIVLGARLDVRVISAISNFEDKRIIHIDVDKFELDKHRAVAYYRFQKRIEDILFDNIQYHNSIPVIQRTTVEENETLNFRSFFSRLKTNQSTIFTLDVGLHQMAGARYIPLKDDDRILSSGGLGSMGYSLPASIGAYYADTSKKILSISGDGGIQMNLQELETIRREKLPIHVFVMNNKCLGMIRQYQDFAFNKRHYATVEGFSSPDYEKLSATFGFKYTHLTSVDQIEKCISELENLNIPSFTEVDIPINDNF